MMPKRPLLALGLLALSSTVLALNLLVSPGFEPPDGTTGWIGYGGNPLIAPSTEAIHGGAQSALISGRTSTYMGIAQNILDKVQANTAYDLRAWVRVRQGGPIAVALGVKKVDGSGTRYTTLDSRTLPAGKWVKLGGYYRFKPTGTATQVQVYVNSPTAGVDIFVDDLSLTPPVAYTPAGGPDTDYVHAAGRDLVVGDPAAPLRLLGTNFTAYGDTGESIDTILGDKNFDQEDYAAVAAAGMNVVRLNLWYLMFEDDAAPYVYKQEGWDWLNKQILWARQAGVRLTLSMMHAQCGYQSNGYTGTFWTGGSGTGSCQDRLRALWTEIAGRYQNEPTVASFDLMNEALPSNQAQYTAYIQTLVNAIRTRNSRHLVQVQTCFASDCEVPPLLTDPNVLYDFHHYDFWRASSQLSYGGGNGDSNMRYGDSTSTVLPYTNDTTAGALWENPPIPTGTTPWTWYEGALFTLNSPNVIRVVPVFIATTNSGKVTFDDFQVTEYDPSGNLVRVVHNVDPEKKPSTWYLLDTYEPFLSYTSLTTTQRLSGTTGSRVIESTGHRGSACVSISNANGKYLVKLPNLDFSGRQGYSYRISGWIKGTNATGGTGALGFQLQNNKSYVVDTPYDRDFLEDSLLTYGFQFSIDHNVPINIGEFGQSPRNFTPERGGLAWIADTLDLMAEYGASGQIWTWHGSAFGIYTNIYGYPDPDAVNQPLLDLFAAQDTGSGSGGGNPPPPPPPPPPPVGTEVIVDNLDAGFSKVGTWNESSVSGEYAASSLVNATLGNAATWTANLTAAGNYAVYAWWGAAGNRVSNAPYAIATAAGTSTVTVDQKVNGGKWNLLGTYAFNAGAATVTLAHPGGTGLWSSADAVRFVPMP